VRDLAQYLRGLDAGPGGNVLIQLGQGGPNVLPG